MHLPYTEQFSAIVSRSRVLNVKMCTKGTTRCEHFLKYLRVHAEGLGRLDALFFKKKRKGRKKERKKELRRKERKEERKKGRKKERTKKERKKGGKEERKKERKN